MRPAEKDGFLLFLPPLVFLLGHAAVFQIKANRNISGTYMAADLHYFYYCSQSRQVIGTRLLLDEQSSGKLMETRFTRKKGFFIKFPSRNSLFGRHLNNKSALENTCATLKLVEEKKVDLPPARVKTDSTPKLQHNNNINNHTYNYL